MSLFSVNTLRKSQPLITTPDRSDAVVNDTPLQPSRKSIDTVVAQGVGQLLRGAKDVLLETVSFSLRRTGAINEHQDRAMRDFVNHKVGKAIRTLYVDIPKYVAGVKEEEARGDVPWIIASRVSYRAAQLSIIAIPFAAAYFLTTNYLIKNICEAIRPSAASDLSVSVPPAVQQIESILAKIIPKLNSAAH